jgi:outer membrane protein OmpA-like peptidoglycan-associated protein
VDTDTDADTDGPPVDTQDPVPDTGDPQTYFSGGSFTGGACATTQWPGGAAAVAAMLLVARRRRRAAVVAVAVGVAPSAAAQEIDAQRFSPSVDGYDTLVVEDTEIAPAGSFGGGLWANYADDPFVYRYDGGEIAVLDDVTTADAVVFYSLGPARFGVDVPVHLATDGFGVTRALNMGDLRLAAKGRLLSRASAPVGLALSAEATLPTANRGNWVGAGATTVGVSASASRALGPVALVAELGVQTGTGEVLDDALRATAALDGGLGVSVRPIDELWFIAEIDGAWWLGNPGAPGAAPVEWRVAARGAPAGDLLLTAGVGSGLSRGVGAPDVRVFGALTWTPGPGRVTLDDPDGDGIVGVADRCPDEAEDVNGTADDDGCPDGAGQVATTFWVSDRYDTPLAGARLELTSGPKTGSWTTGSDGSLGMALPPGNYRVSAEMPSYAPATLDLTLAGPSQSVVLQLLPPTDVGKVTVRVVGPSGRAVPRAEVRVLGTLGQPLVTGADGILEASLSTGAYEVTVAAEGWVAQTRGIKVSPTSAADLTVVLMPEEVTIDAEAKQIYLHKKVFFELEKAELLVESYKVLDALVEVLVDHPEIRKIRVEGHTDTQGTDAYNQELSESRAAAVGAYLVKAGIKQDRIETVGLGESRTLQSGDSEDVHATNRRVEVHILEITEKP